MSAVMEQNNCDVVAHLHAPATNASTTSSNGSSSSNSSNVTSNVITTTTNTTTNVIVNATSSSSADIVITVAAEIEALKQALFDKQQQLVALEAVCLRESDRQVELEDSVIAWQDKYDRLYESHKRVQKVNQSLEDKLLKMVDRNSGERAQLTSDVATLSVRLAQANFNIAKLQREIERYKADINLAIQLLQCKPDSFVAQKVSSLPIDIQSKVSAYMRLETNSHSDSEGSTSGVGVATSASYKVLPASDSPPPAPCPFPPTAMVYSMRGLDAKNDTNSNSTLNVNNNNINNNNLKDAINNNNNNSNSTNNSTPACTVSPNNSNNNHQNAIPNSDSDMIAPIIMAKFLEDELKAGEIKHCDTCQCSKQDLTVLADVSRSYTVATQTPFQLTGGGIGGNLNEPLTQLCLRCNSNLNSPSRTNSPYFMKLVKSSDSVISETKSSVSDLNDMDKLFTPAKKDDLMVNPILGHHRLCDRTSGSNGLCAGGGSKLTSTMLYPTTHLGAYAAEKYLLETSNLAVGLSSVGVAHLKNGYQRRFMDGGGSALELLDKFEPNVAGGTPNAEKSGGCCGNNDELEDERKPLLRGGLSQTNLLHEVEKAKISNITTDANDCLPTANTKAMSNEQIKSPASTCSAANAKNNNNCLIKSNNISGSVNSLWSKASSCEGAKMFENFNRNLIKTIKAENPKYRGPRLCAMRIQQNGQSNILLDNIESIEAVTPIIYKRRERLLDEELDDTKDIITSKTTAMSSLTLPQPLLQSMVEPQVDEAAPQQTAIEELVKEDHSDDICIGDDLWAKNVSIQVRRNEIEEEYQQATGGNGSVTDTGGGEVADSGGAVDGVLESTDSTAGVIEMIASTVATPAASTAEIVEETTRIEQKTVNEDVELTTIASINNDDTVQQQQQQQQQDQSNLMQLQVSTPAAALLGVAVSAGVELKEKTLLPNYEILRNESSSKNSLNSKSCTQSSSISDVIDFQESVILRRQQLNRVAEWVQNNTQQLEKQQQQQQQHQQQQVINVINHCGDSSGGTEDRQSSFSTLDHLDSISMEKLSMDSGYKTTPQPQTNGVRSGCGGVGGSGGSGIVADGGYARDDTNKSTEDSLSPKTDTASNHNNNINHHYHQPHSQLQKEQKYQRAGVYMNRQKQQQQELLNASANTFYRRTSRSGLPIAYTTSENHQSHAYSHHHHTTATTTTTTSSSTTVASVINTATSTITTTPPILPTEQPKCDILNYRYYPSESDKTRSIKAELHTTTQNVDIAQMEYNVKQFLLKQNEWSMRSAAAAARKGEAVAAGIGTSNGVPATQKAHPSTNQIMATERILRQMKLFSNAAIGPGVGERVHIAAPQKSTTTTIAVAVGEATPANDTPSIVQRATLPQRTETNL